MNNRRTKLDHHRRAFTLRDLLVVVFIVGLAIMLLLPAITVTRPPALRNSCINNMKQLVLATHNYADSQKHFPNTGKDNFKLDGEDIVEMSPLTTQIAASTRPDDRARYSWIVSILPYTEETKFYNGIQRTSDRLHLPAFDPANVVFPSSQHASTVELAPLLCPANEYERIAAAPEYVSWLGVDASTGRPNGVAITNYAATAATEIDLIAHSPTKANGVIVPEGRVTFADIKDGQSFTVILAETREPAYASWYDAGTTWLVATPPQLARTSAEAAALKSNGSAPMLNYGPAKEFPDRMYLPKDQWANSQGRAWGASSNHPGVVIHGFADGSVKSLSDDIDPQVYRALVSRDGNETIPRAMSE